MITSYIADDNSDWDQYVSLVTFAYNTSKHSSTGVVPFTYIFGDLPTMPIDHALLPSALLKPSTNASHQQCIDQLRKRLLAIRDLGYFNSLKAARRVEVNRPPMDDVPK